MILMLRNYNLHNKFDSTYGEKKIETVNAIFICSMLRDLICSFGRHEHS